MQSHHDHVHANRDGVQSRYDRVHANHDAVHAIRDGVHARDDDKLALPGGSQPMPRLFSVSFGMTFRPIPPGPGQESVWDYPRPPRLEESRRQIEVRFGGLTLASTRRAYRVLETSHPPVYYLPPADVRLDLLVEVPKRTFCEWKGIAHYYDVVAGEHRAPAAAWFYPDPTPAFAALRDHIAVYPQAMEACFVDGERVQAQEGDFYGGWITKEIVGPFKGAPGTGEW
jgi:uncharacterized protein (DUF427 family)